MLQTLIQGRDENDRKMEWGEKGYFALFFPIINPSTFYHSLFSLPFLLVSLFISYMDNDIKEMEKEIKDQTLKSKCMPHLLAQIPQMKDLIFRAKIFPGNTVQV